MAADGGTVEGPSHIDESFITGESLHVAKGVGEKAVSVNELRDAGRVVAFVGDGLNASRRWLRPRLRTKWRVAPT